MTTNCPKCQMAMAIPDGQTGAFQCPACSEKFTFPAQAIPVAVPVGHASVWPQWARWEIGARVIFIASICATISMLMPWVDVGIVSRNGFQQISVFFLAFYVYPFWMLLANKPINKLAGLIVSLSAVAAALAYFLSNWVDNFDRFDRFTGSSNFTGVGCFFFIASSIALCVGIGHYRNDLR